MREKSRSTVRPQVRQVSKMAQERTKWRVRVKRLTATFWFFECNCKKLSAVEVCRLSGSEPPPDTRENIDAT